MTDRPTGRIVREQCRPGCREDQPLRERRRPDRYKQRAPRGRGRHRRYWRPSPPICRQRATRPASSRGGNEFLIQLGKLASVGPPRFGRPGPGRDRPQLLRRADHRRPPRVHRRHRLAGPAEHGRQGQAHVWQRRPCCAGRALRLARVARPDAAVRLWAMGVRNQVPRLGKSARAPGAHRARGTQHGDLFLRRLVEPSPGGMCVWAMQAVGLMALPLDERAPSVGGDVAQGGGSQGEDFPVSRTW
jgi:hypothetical protein